MALHYLFVHYLTNNTQWEIFPLLRLSELIEYSVGLSAATSKGNTPLQNACFSTTLPHCACELTANHVFCSWLPFSVANAGQPTSFSIEALYTSIGKISIECCKDLLPVRNEVPLTNPFLGGHWLWYTEWLMIMYSLAVSSHELSITKSRFFNGAGHETEILNQNFYQIYKFCLGKDGNFEWEYCPTWANDHLSTTTTFWCPVFHI